MVTMTGEKIRAMRKEQSKPNKNEESSNGTIPNGTGNHFRSNKAFLRASARQQQLNANNINGNSSSTDSVVNDDNKNPIILTSEGQFPVHECVYKGDVRRLSSLIRTHSITKKDVHGDSSAFCRECVSMDVDVSRSSSKMHLFGCRKHPSAPGSDAGPQR